jgi:large subunit ribosomal protein L7/L12
MPASSFRSLRLLSSSVIRADRKQIIVHPQNNNNSFIVGRYNQRDVTTSSWLISSSTGSSGADRTRLLSTLSNSSFSDHHRQQQRRCPHARTTNSSMTLTSRAHFHSSPLSWFAADDNKEEPGKKEEEKDVTTTAADNKEEPKKEEKDVTTTETTSSNDDGEDNATIEGDDTNEEPSATDVTYDFTAPAPLSQDSQDKVQAIFDKVLFLDMIEVHLLTQVVNEHMGISWKETEQRMSGRGGGVSKKAGAGDAATDEPVEEKTIFDLKLLGFDAKSKIKVIKEVRNIAGLGLKEAKEMVEGAPKVIKKELKKEKAEELKLQLEAVGATVELV